VIFQKGRDVSFDLESGKRVVPSRACAMLHDPAGEHWPKCSLLVTRFSHGRRRATQDEMRGAPEHYLGKNYPARVGSLVLPPKDILAWIELGPIKTLYYTRDGAHAAVYFHNTNKPKGLYKMLFIIKGEAPLVLYRFGTAYRFEVPGGCIIADDRGVVWP
jgi:hypothetical protein